MSPNKKDRLPLDVYLLPFPIGNLSWILISHFILFILSDSVSSVTLYFTVFLFHGIIKMSKVNMSYHENTKATPTTNRDGFFVWSDGNSFLVILMLI